MSYRSKAKACAEEVKLKLKHVPALTKLLTIQRYAQSASSRAATELKHVLALTKPHTTRDRYAQSAPRRAAAGAPDSPISPPVGELS